MSTRLKDIHELSDDNLIIRVAELCGWKSFVGTGNKIYWNKPNGNYAGGDTFNPLPQFTGDLNAMHEAEKKLNDAQYSQYQDTCRVLAGYHWFSATARQRAEAFVLTMEERDGTR